LNLVKVGDELTVRAELAALGQTSMRFQVLG
jgi:acyl-CoA hydrolase